MLKYSAHACLLWLVLFTLTILLPSTSSASSTHAFTRNGRPQTSTEMPGIDPNYIYHQLDYLVTHFQQREAGYQSAGTNGHDGFANYWSREMLNLLGSYGAQVRSDPFSIAGWAGRPARVPAVNVEVTVPGVLHPEQVVVIGCHYDGEAISTQSANDDGSGCAIELGVARAMSEFWQKMHVYPARTLRFVLFDAEEQGLLGSFHYVNSTASGDLTNIVAMFNEEQNGIAYPLRYLGSMANELMPFYIAMSPLRNTDLYPDQDHLSTQQRANITRFRQLMQQAVVASFEQFRAMGDQMLTYHASQGKDAWQPIFTSDQLSAIHQEDDTLGGSDQIPFTLAGLPCATFAGNSTYYNANAPQASYPFDQPQDTLQLMNIFASGNSQQSQALTLALGFPGMLTTWMLSQPDILGQTPADANPIAAISSIGPTLPGQVLTLDAGASYDPGRKNSTLSYHWNFGDGGSAEGQRVSHTYKTTGSYTLQLTVTSAAGGTRVLSKSINVAPATVYNNPFSVFHPNGAPRANSGVTLPTATAGLSDRVGTLADSQRQGPITQPTSAPHNTGSSILIWLGLTAVLALIAIVGILLRVRHRAKQASQNSANIP